MEQNLSYINDILKPTINEPVIPKVLDNGYRPVILGALNYTNASGIRYLATDDVIGLFKESVLARRLRTKRLYFENGHPRREHGMSAVEYKAILLGEAPDRNCGHCRKIELLAPTEEQLEINGVTKETIMIRGEVAPSGTQAKALEDSFNNPDEDTCFSVRSFARPVLHNNKPARVITNLLKFDKVDEPGLAVASAAENLSLENLNTVYGDTWTMEDLQAVETYISNIGADISNEARIDTIAELMVQMDRHNDVRERVHQENEHNAKSRLQQTNF